MNSSLSSLDVSKFETENVLIMTEMFKYMRYLTSINLSNFYTPSLTEMNELFFDCSNL